MSETEYRPNTGERRKGEPIRAKDWNEIARALNQKSSGTMPGDLAGNAGIAARQFQVVTEHDDHIDCVFQHGTDVVPVAKPFALRGSVTGIYTFGLLIIAITHILGGTGIAGIEWQDISFGGQGSGGTTPPPPPPPTEFLYS